MDDDAIVQIISRLGVDFSQAIVGVEQLSAGMVKLNTELTQIQAKTKMTAQELATVFQSTSQSMTQNAAKTKTGEVMGEKIKRDFSKKMLETEVLLRRTMADAAKAGAYLPSNTERSLGYIQTLQTKLANGEKLSQQEKKSVEAIAKRARLQQLELQSSAQALKLEQARAAAVGHVADQTGRVGLAQKQNTELARLDLVNLNQKLAKMQATVQTKQLENSLTAIGSKTLGSELTARQAELTNLIKQLEVNGKLNAQEMQRLNLLKGQVTALDSNVKAASAQASIITTQAASAAKAEKEAAKANKKAADEAKKHTKSVQDLSKEYNVLGSQFDRRASWFIAGSAFFGSITAMKEVVSTIKDVEMGMTTIARITEDVTFNFKEMRNELQGFGVEYGMTWQYTSDIATKWAQAGYNTADTLELTQASLLALNTAELNATQATQGLIAIMAQWGLTADQLLPTIDKINVTADNYAVSSQDLVDGLNRSSGAAKVLGLTLNETIGILTVMREATGRTGREVGNALNSILSFMQRPTAIKRFETEGIRVFADEARTQFRNVIEIFDEMASKWPTMSVEAQNIFAEQAEQAGLYSEEMAEAIGLQKEWTDIQQRDLSQAAAGIYRRNYLLALLQNWSKVDEVLIGLEDSLGYSMRENERTMATLAKQWEALKAAAEQFAVAIGDAGLLDQLKGLVEGAIDAVTWFNNLDDSMKTLVITFGEVAIAMKLINSMMGMMGLAGAGAAGGIMKGWAVPLSVGAMTKSGIAEAQKLTAELNAVGKAKFTAPTYAIQNMSKGMIALKTATSGAAVAFRNLGVGAVAAFGGPWMIALAAAIAGIYTMVKNIKEANATMIEHAQTAESVIGQYDELQNTLGNLEKGTESYNKAQKELNDLTLQIGQALPEVVTGYNEATGAIELNEKALRDMAKASKDYKAALDAEKESIDAKRAALEKQAEQADKEAQSAQNNKQVLLDLIQRRNELNQALSAQGEGSKDVSKLEEELAEIDRLIADTALDGGYARLKAAGFTEEAIDKEITKLEELRIASLKNKRQMIQDQIEETEAAQQNALDRIKIYEKEIEALSAKRMPENGKLDWTNSGFTGALLSFGKDLLPGSKLGGVAETNYKRSIEAAQEMSKAKSEYDAETEKLRSQEEALAGIKRDILGVKPGSGTTGGGDTTGDTGGSSGTGKQIDYITEALQRLSDAANQYELANMDLESSLESVNRSLAISDAEYAFLTSKVETGTATAQDYARMQELVAQKSAYLKNEQMQLTNANKAYQSQIDSLTPVLAKATAEYERYKAAGDEEHTKDAADAVSSLKGEIDDLSGSIATNTQKLWENKATLEELTRSTYAQYYQSAMDWMSHMDAIGRMNTQQQLEYLKTIDDTKLAQADAWKLEEQEFSKRKELLQEEMDAIKRAYDDRMDMYEAEIKANESAIESKEKGIESFKAGIDSQIAAIQKLMDALDDDADKEDKEEAERQHNLKLAELTEEWLYHELRTGLEHVEAMADIDEQIAEENRRWQLQQNDWARDAQKKAYQDQIDALNNSAKKQESSARKEINQLKKTNDSKKQEMQKYYQQIEAMLNENTLNMLASLGSANDQMYQKGLEWMRSLAQGIKDGQTEIPSGLSGFVDDVEDEYNNLPSGSNTGRPTVPVEPKQRLKAVVSADQYINENGRTYMKSMDLAGLLGKSVDWDGSRVIIGGRAFTPYKNVNGRTYVGIREVAEALGYIVSYDDSSRMVSIWDKAHTGAYVESDGIAELRHDERVLSPQLTLSFEKLASALSQPIGQSRIASLGGSPGIERKLDRLIAVMERRGSTQVNGPAVNIEHAEFENKYDGQSLGVDVRNTIAALGY